jgi:hypothetical protein
MQQKINKKGITIIRRIKWNEKAKGNEEKIWKKEREIIKKEEERLKEREYDRKGENDENGLD